MIELSRMVGKINASMTLALNAKAGEMKSKGLDVISFSLGEPDLDTPDHIKQGAIDALRNGKTKYTATDGIPELKKAIQSWYVWHEKRDYVLNQIIVTCGGKQAIENAMRAILNPGDEVIIPAPYWLTYPEQAMLNAAAPVIVKTTEESRYKLTPEGLERSITARSRMLIINSPGNPTGEVYTPGELRALAEVLKKYPDIVILSDDIYNQMVYGTLPWTNILDADPTLSDRTIIINGVSKTYSMTGLRIGYALGPVEVIDAMGRIQSQSTSNPCSTSQWASVAALNGPQDCVMTMKNTFEKRRQKMAELMRGIPDVSFDVPDGAFFLFPNVSAYYNRRSGISDSITLCQYLLEEAHIALVPGVVFGDDGCVRISYAASDDAIEKGLERMARALKKL